MSLAQRVLRDAQHQVEEIRAEGQGQPRPRAQQRQVHVVLELIVPPTVQNEKDQNCRRREEDQQLEGNQELDGDERADQHDDDVDRCVRDRVDRQHPRHLPTVQAYASASIMASTLATERMR